MYPVCVMGFWLLHMCFNIHARACLRRHVGFYFFIFNVIVMVVDFRGLYCVITRSSALVVGFIFCGPSEIVKLMVRNYW